MLGFRQTPAGRAVRKAILPAKKVVRRAKQYVRTLRKDPAARKDLDQRVGSAFRAAGQRTASGIRRVHSLSRSIRNLGQV